MYGVETMTKHEVKKAIEWIEIFDVPDAVILISVAKKYLEDK